MAFMSGLWNSIVGGNEKEVTWEEYSSFYFDNFKKYFSVSEVDKEENTIVFGETHKISFNKNNFGLDYTPLNFVTIYHIDTRKGWFKIFLKRNNSNSHQYSKQFWEFNMKQM